MGQNPKVAMLSDSTLPAPEGVDDEIAEQWRFLAHPGATLTGRERVSAAAAARHARRGTPATGGPIERAAALISRAAHEITADVVEKLGDEGLNAHRYIETLGVVARTTAIDTAVRGLGAAELSLPEPVDGEPTGEIDPEAKKRSAFIPTVGPANPMTALSALPAETQHQESLSDLLYLSYEQMLDFDIQRDLHRTQLELVAARTSSINECVY